MFIESEKIILRNMVVSDIDDVIYWNTEATEWMQWDAPWEHEAEDNFDWDAYRIKKKQSILTHNDGGLQTRLEVCLNDDVKTHIGAVSCYFIDKEYRIDENSENITIGLDIYEKKYRGNGYGKQAYQMYITYLKSLGYRTIYTQTWSGNTPLIKMAEKLGFKECNRYVGIRNVRNTIYDGLTFALKL